MRKLLTLLFFVTSLAASAQLKFSDFSNTPPTRSGITGKWVVGYGVGSPNINYRYPMANFIFVDDTSGMLANYRHWLMGYLTKTAADGLYQPIGSYLTASSLSPYLLSSTAASTYLTQANAATTYQPTGSYATTSQVSGKLNITDTGSMLNHYQHWNAGYLKTETDPKRIVSVVISGTATKTVTITLADATTVTGTFTDQTGGAGGGITSLNGDNSSTQSFATGTTGTDFTIVTAGGVHTFNFPTASSTKRGLLSATDWVTFNNKLSSEADPSALKITNNLSDVNNAATARTNLGLGTAATQPATAFEPANSNIQTHILATNNPHGVTKAQVALGNVDNTSDANKPVSTAQQTALNTKAPALVPTSVKTTAYTASAQDFIPVDVSSSSVAITLPSAPADGTLIGVKIIATNGTNTVTVNRSGSDIFNKVGGSTSLSLSVLYEAINLQYQASTGIWYVRSSDAPLSQLDNRYGAYFSGMSGTGASTSPFIADSIRVKTSGTTVGFGASFFETTDTSLNVTYGGSTFKFKANGSGGSSSSGTTLSAPSLTASVVSSSAIDVTVGSVTNASSYILDWSANGTSGWTSLATTSGVYNHTSLTASTPYYYRARAVGDGTTYLTSSYATANATTSAGGGGGGGTDVTYTTVSGLAETSTGSKIWTGFINSYGVSSTSASGDFTYQVTYAAATAGGAIGVSLSSTADNYTNTSWFGGVYAYGGKIWFISNGTGYDQSVSAVDGDILRVRRTSGVLWAEYSRNSGSTWTLLNGGSSLGSFSGTAYFKAATLVNSATVNFPQTN